MSTAVIFQSCSPSDELELLSAPNNPFISGLNSFRRDYVLHRISIVSMIPGLWMKGRKGIPCTVHL